MLATRAAAARQHVAALRVAGAHGDAAIAETAPVAALGGAEAGQAALLSPSPISATI